MLNREIFNFGASAFPGAYRALVFFMIIFFLSEDSASKFSSQYFWLGFVSSVSGVPLAALCFSKTYNLKFFQLSLVLVGMSLLSSTVIYCLSGEFSLRDQFIFSSAIIIIGYYEVYRSKLAVKGEFHKVFYAAIFSILIACSIIHLLHFFPSYALLFFSLPLVLPLLFFPAKNPRYS